MNVAKGISCFLGSFATIDMHKLVVHQVGADDGHDFLDVSLILIQHFGIHIKRWRFFGSVHNIPKIHGCQQHFNFKLPKVELSPLNLLMILAASLLNDVIVCSDIRLRHSNHSNKIFFTLNLLHYEILQVTFSTPQESSKNIQITQIRSSSPQMCLTLIETSQNSSLSSRMLLEYKHLQSSQRKPLNSQNIQVK